LFRGRCLEGAVLTRNMNRLTEGWTG